MIPAGRTIQGTRVTPAGPSVSRQLRLLPLGLFRDQRQAPLASDVSPIAR